MGRLQLFEFEDQPWFPAMIRDGMTDFFSFGAQLSSRPYQAFATKLDKAMATTGDHTVVELGAGGGGHSLAIAGQLPRQAPVKVVLTDLFPNLPRLRMVKAAGRGLTVDVVETPVDATAVPASLAGFRLICNAFHHLPPAVASACLADAVRQRQGIAVMELVGRSPFGFFQVFSGALLVFLAMPLVRPFKWSRLFFTYILPLIPLAILSDGIASCFRVYSPDELRALVAGLPENDYAWDIGIIRVPMMPITMTYLIGTPAQKTR